MDEIPKNIEKELTQLSSARTRKSKKRWTVLFVDERGRIRAFRYFRGIMVFSGFLLFAAIVFSAGIYLFYEQALDKNVLLKGDLKVSKQRVRTLTREKEKLTAQLVVTESRLEALREKPKTPPPENMKMLPVIEEAVAEKSESLPTELVELPKPAVPEIPEEVPAIPAVTLEIPSSPTVDIDEFKVSRNVERNQFEIQFKVRNMKPGTQQVSGYTFVLLKGKAADPENWFVFPEAEMVSGRPVQIRNGRHFSISRFKTVKLDTQGRILESSIHTATVMVFNKKGELLLEKNFPINEKPAASGG